MGLKTDIYNAYETLISNGGKVKLSEPQINNIDKLSQDLTSAIIVFLSKQTWQITDLKAFVELDELEITEQQPGKINKMVKVATNIAVSTTGGAGSTTSLGLLTGTINDGTHVSGVTIPKIKSTKTGNSKGGKLKATGHAFVGSETNNPAQMNLYDTNGDNEGWNQFSKVKLNIDDLIDFD